MNGYQYILYMHIAAGFVALFVAPIAMIVKKGGPAHRLWGKCFFWSIAFVAFSALVMSVWKINIFLGTIAVFSFYLAATGYRVLYRRNINTIKDVSYIDWILVVISGLFCFALIMFGVLLVIKNQSNAFGYISVVFGFIGFRSVVIDIICFNKPLHYKKNWLYHHIGNMTGAYIATVSAFSAVNFHFLPTVIQWLWPTIIGVPLIMLWNRKYRNKKSEDKSKLTLNT